MARWPLARGDEQTLRSHRHEFRAFLRKHRVRDLDTLELVFGELIANAVRYGDDPMQVIVVIRDGLVHVHVDNSGECFDLQECLDRTPGTTGGRGLQIVRALAASLTVEGSDFHPCCVTAIIPVSKGAA